MINPNSEQSKDLMNNKRLFQFESWELWEKLFKLIVLE